MANAVSACQRSSPALPTWTPGNAQAQGFCQLAPFDYDFGRWARPATHAPLPQLPNALVRASQKIIDVAMWAAGLGHVELMRGDETLRPC